MIKIFTYKNCSTCRKATKWMDQKGLPFEEFPIRESPPSVAELKRMLDYYDGELSRLFNSSGGDYRELDLKHKLPEMSCQEALELLSRRGNLVKRPFLIAGDFGLVGFREDEWNERFQ